jgi:hypothetical protein
MQMEIISNIAILKLCNSRFVSVLIKREVCTVTKNTTEKYVYSIGTNSVFYLQ